MATFIAPTGGGEEFKKLSPGMYVARCVSLIQLGTHEEEYEGVKKMAFKLWIGFEFPTELDTFKEGGQPEPYTMGREVKFSMFETAALRKMLESWRGKKFTQDEANTFDVGKLLGVPCLINITSYVKKNGNGGVRIDTVSPQMRGQDTPAQITPTQAFSLTPSEYDQAVLDALPRFLQDKIKASPEYAKIMGNQPPVVPPVQAAGQRLVPAGEDDSDDLPF